MKKYLMIFIATISVIAVIAIASIFMLNHSVKGRIYTADIIFHEQDFRDDMLKVSARINFPSFAPLLRSTQIASVAIDSYAWNDAVGNLEHIRHSGRNIYFNTTQDLRSVGTLGSVEYAISFMPFIKTILKYYAFILALVAFFISVNKLASVPLSLLQNISFRLSMSYFIFVVSLFITSSIGFIVKVSIMQGYFYASLVLSLFALLFRNPHKIKSLVCYALFAFVAVFMAFYVYDYSWDGRAYHQIGIFYLANGWNPIYEEMQEMTHLSPFLSHSIWIEHYLKFAEITQSCVYKAIGFIESGKIINWIFTFGAFLYGIATLSKLRFLNAKMAIWLSFLAVFSPVVMTQISTYYLDGLLGVALVFVVLAILDLELESKRYKYGIFILALLATASIKLTGVAYAGFIGIAFLCYKLYRKQFCEAKNVFFSGAIALVLIIAFNVNPLVNNQIQHGHFGYPLMGKDKIDIITSQQPQNFNDNNRFEKIFKSLFGKTQNILSSGNSELKIPFIKYKGESLSDPDVRVAGFGYFFSGILLLCAILMLLNLKGFMQRAFIFYFALILGSCLINPELWWARYVPQMWLLPFTIIIFSFKLSLNRISHYLRNATIFFLALSFLFTVKLPLNTGYKNAIQSQLDRIKTDEVFVYMPLGWEKSFNIKLIEKGVKVHNLDKAEFERLSKEMKFYRLESVLDNHRGNQSFWSVESPSLNYRRQK